MPTDSRARKHPTAVFYGDSIVTGWRGTTTPTARWTGLVCAELGWRGVDLAVDGMGWFRRRGPRDTAGELTPSATDTTLLDAAIHLAPDVVVTCLAANDAGFVDHHADEIRASMRRDLIRLRNELPGVPVVVTAYVPARATSQRLTTVLDWLVATAKELGLVHAEDSAHAVGDDPDLLCDDGIHPNDAGHAALAASVLPTLRRLVL
ncbi:SGNH/GDSL hydrolase family protein [Nocardioides sp. KIGAM211]|uniref:SGNH/GDSL hydrolase family protein n=1 Tax=Nocardioides luti TaxID=2761101 RepID=A0A7X0RJN0_9ACTN|nr:SGNH/GDSL hydrolase family protein [Nocardioides luti]